MAADRPYEPTLIGIPKELRLNIFRKLFEDECLQYGRDTHSIYEWPHQVLQTCSTLYREATEAIVAKVAECELDYCDHLPPESEYGPEAEFGPGDEYWHLYGDHVKFLRRYGHLIRYVRTYGPENFGEINLRWFPNLEIFTLAGHDYLTVSKEDIKYSGGKMDTARLFELFDDWYKDFDESLMSEEKMAEVAGRKGVDRKYGVYVELDLEVKDVGHYVSVLEHYSNAELITCSTSDLTWTRRRYTRIVAGR